MLLAPETLLAKGPFSAYVPGKCNIGRRGRIVRMATGVSIILLSVLIRFTLLSFLNLLFSLSLILPLYIGFIAILEGTMSFCVLHASKGSYDLSEPRGFPTGKSSTRQSVISEESRRIDRVKAHRMHIEALGLAIFLGILLALA